MKIYEFIVDEYTVSSAGENRAKARYQLWLSYSQFCGATFHEFLKVVKNV